MVATSNHKAPPGEYFGVMEESLPSWTPKATPTPETRTCDMEGHIPQETHGALCLTGQHTKMQEYPSIFEMFDQADFALQAERQAQQPQPQPAPAPAPARATPPAPAAINPAPAAAPAPVVSAAPPLAGFPMPLGNFPFPGVSPVSAFAHVPLSAPQPQPEVLGRLMSLMERTE